MGLFSGEKPKTSITQTINRLLPDKPLKSFEPELEINDLLISIKLQGSDGPTEAARAIRKRLKYGSVQAQYNALTILEILVLNGGKSLESLYCDPKLINRLKTILSDWTYNSQVRQKLILMIDGWNEQFDDDSMYAELTLLRNHIPKNSKIRMSNSIGKALSKRNNEAKIETIKEYTSESDRIYDIPVVPIEQLEPELKKLIADSNATVVELDNCLKSLDKVSGGIPNEKCVILFEKCKQIRRKVLRYLQIVTEGMYLGILIKANEDIVKVLNTYTDLLNINGDIDSKNSLAETERLTQTNINNDTDTDSDLIYNDYGDDDDDDYDDDDDDDDNPFTDKNKV